MSRFCYFNDYFGCGEQHIDLTVGLKSKREAIRYGHRLCAEKGYGGFRVLRKPPVAGIDPEVMSVHCASVSARRVSKVE